MFVMKIYKSFAHKITLCKEKNSVDFFACQLSCSNDVATYARQFYSDDIGIFESFFLICLDVKNKTIAWQKIGQGGVSAVMVDPLLIAKYAIECLAKGVILIHNHPSGGLKPSQNDINLTNKVRDGLKLFDISVIDHVILSEDSYYSFADNGLI